jgi:hypothetical protein
MHYQESNLRLRSNQQKLRRFIAGNFAGLCLFACMASGAQTVADVGAPVAPAENARTLMAADVLPDAPSAMASSSSVAVAEGGAAAFEMGARRRDGAAGTAAAVPEASRTQMFIQAGQTAPQLSAHETVVLGVKSSFSLITIAGWFTSAGWSQWMNSAPNYGTDRGAFGERLGAAALCNSSEDLLSFSVMAPLLHEDPRYYRMGPGHNFFTRLVYAGTRPIITRTNSGHLTPNLALILGNAEGAALSNAYYPQVNRGAEQTMENLGLSISGSAIGDVIGEFYGDVLKAFHLGHP